MILIEKQDGDFHIVTQMYTEYSIVGVIEP